MKKQFALTHICFCLIFCLLPLLSLGQKKAALLSFTVQGLPEQVQRQMTPQAVDSLHSSLVRQLVRTHRLSSMIPQQPEKITFVAKGRQKIPKRLKAHQLVAGPDIDLYFRVVASLQNKTVFAGLQLPAVQVKMAVFDRTGKRLLLTESLGKDGIAHSKQPAADLEQLLDQDRFRKMYFRAVASLRTGGLSPRL
jgi:hypothetical protein